jgi:hypothetical protein
LDRGTQQLSVRAAAIGGPAMPETEIYVARGGRAAVAATRGAAAPSAYSIVVRFEGGLTET